MSGQRITVKDIDALVRQGELSGKDVLVALNTIRDKEYWQRWGLRILLGLAVAHLLFSLSLFIAANWNAISSFQKLGGLTIAITALAAIAYKRGLDDLWAHIAIIAAQSLVGLWLVVFSQIYQTGADNYQLYLSWALLILPWTLMARAQASWVLFLTILTIGFWLYSYQHLAINGLAPISLTTGLITLLLTGILSIGEGLRERQHHWLDAHWGRLLLLAAIIIHAEYATIYLLVLDNLGGMTRIALPAMALTYLTALYWLGRRGLPFFGLILLSWAIFVGAHGIWLIAKLETDWIVFSFSALFVIALTAIVARAFNQVQQRRRPS